MREALALKGVTKRYGKVTAVESLTLDVAEGEVFGFLGPNGAGKTTTLRMLLDLIRPTSGALRVLGRDPHEGGTALRQGIGYVSGEPALYGHLTGQQHLELASRRRGGYDAHQVERLAQRLDARLDRRVDRLSHGNRQKVAIILAFTVRPTLLLLDEPTQGLDPLAREVVHDLIREERANGVTVFLSSHDLHEVEEVCDRVALIREGRLVTVTPVNELLASQPRSVLATLRQAPPAGVLDGVAGVQDAKVRGTQVEARVLPPLGPFLQALQPFGVVDLVSRPPDLEDLFLEHYRGPRHA